MKCEDCGHEKPDVHKTTCPFADDVYGEVVEVCLCDDCYQERVNDI
jgi:hypothetical protein